MQNSSSSFAKLSKLGCWKKRECLVCVRDKSLTDVRMQEVGPILEAMREPIDQWVKARWRDMSIEGEVEAVEGGLKTEGEEGAGMGVKGSPVVVGNPDIKGDPVVVGDPIINASLVVTSNPVVKAIPVAVSNPVVPTPVVSEKNTQEKARGVGEVARSKDGEVGGGRKGGGRIQGGQMHKGGNGGEKARGDQGKGSVKGQGNMKDDRKGRKEEGEKGGAKKNVGTIGRRGGRKRR